MKILLGLTYFEPYHSGLSIYAFRLAQGLSQLGHEVTVLTSKHDPGLKGEERFGNINVVRVPVGLRLSKGVIMPRLRRFALPWINWADVVNLHLPQFESYWLSALCHELNKPLVVTYHCDLVGRRGAFDRLAVQGTQLLQNRALNLADKIVQNSMDYAQNSPALRRRLVKVAAIPTPVNAERISPEESARFKAKYNILSGQIILGLAGRVAAEKGIEYLLEAFPEILRSYPSARIVHAGAWESVIGEKSYQDKIEKMAEPFGDRFVRLGYLENEEFSAFFSACDLLVFSSLNATESFGIVQIEALTQHTPIVATDLPGVRQPVLQTGFGRVVPAKSSSALAEAVISILSERPEVPAGLPAYLDQFRQENVARQYESLFQNTMKQ